MGLTHVKSWLVSTRNLFPTTLKKDQKKLINCYKLSVSYRDENESTVVDLCKTSQSNFHCLIVSTELFVGVCVMCHDSRNVSISSVINIFGIKELLQSFMFMNGRTRRNIGSFDKQ